MNRELMEALDILEKKRASVRIRCLELSSSR